MIDSDIITALADAQIACGLIGAHALARHGVVRYTVDVDLLVTSTRVLDSGFWSPSLATRVGEIRRGDDDELLAGLVRFASVPPVDLLVGRGDIMRRAVADAVFDVELGVAVATPIDLVMLKLEAGGPQDLADIVSLVDAQRELNPGDDMVALVELRHEALSDWGRRAWARVRLDLVAAAGA